LTRKTAAKFSSEPSALTFAKNGIRARRSKPTHFVGRSLFDLWSNFTFFLADPLYGDEIQQHDSRLQKVQMFNIFSRINFSAVSDCHRRRESSFQSNQRRALSFDCEKSESQISCRKHQQPGRSFNFSAGKR
jgi:hypothetical protein